MAEFLVLQFVVNPYPEPVIYVKSNPWHKASGNIAAVVVIPLDVTGNTCSSANIHFCPVSQEERQFCQGNSAPGDKTVSAISVRIQAVAPEICSKSQLSGKFYRMG